MRSLAERAILRSYLHECARAYFRTGRKFGRNALTRAASAQRGCLRSVPKFDNGRHLRATRCSRGLRSITSSCISLIPAN